MAVTIAISASIKQTLINLEERKTPDVNNGMNDNFFS